MEGRGRNGDGKVMGEGKEDNVSISYRLCQWESAVLTRVPAPGGGEHCL